MADVAELCGFGAKVRSPGLCLPGSPRKQLGTGLLAASRCCPLAWVRFHGPGACHRLHRACVISLVPPAFFLPWTWGTEHFEPGITLVSSIVWLSIYLRSHTPSFSSYF